MALTPFLQKLGLEHIEGQLKNLGVDSFADLAYVREEDLELKPIQLRKFLHHRPAPPDPSMELSLFVPKRCHIVDLENVNRTRRTIVHGVARKPGCAFSGASFTNIFQ